MRLLRLLPMYKETWAEFGKRLDVGDRVNVEVVRLWKADLYRWPIELKALNPEIQKFMYFCIHCLLQELFPGFHLKNGILPLI